MNCSSVLIRPLREEDAYISCSWRNDPEVWAYTGKRPDKLITPEFEVEWIKNVLAESDSYRFAILADNEYVGNIQITNVVTEEGEYHIFIGKKDYWGKGIATLATQQLLRYAKERLNLKRIYLVVKPHNTPAIKVYERCGFIRVSDEIKMVFDLSQDLKPIVSVFMMTYNHDSYIRQAVESILCQKTSFDFDIVIGEDCSTDSTRSIVMSIADQYPGKFKLLLHEKNIGAVANQMAVLLACTGKYIAICEGDDYWTDPLKLQKQVEFLEGNEECVVCGTRFLEEKVQNGKKIYTKGRETAVNRMFYYKDSLHGRAPFQTCSLMIRKNAIGNIEIPKGVYNGDKLLMMNVLEHGGYGVILTDYTCVYRVHSGGAWSGSRKTEIYLSYVNLFNSYKKIIPKIYHKDAKKLLGDFSLKLVISLLKEGEWAQARKYIRFLKINYSSFRIVYNEILILCYQILIKSKIKKPKVVAEIVCNHKGSMEIAKK